MAKGGYTAVLRGARDDLPGIPIHSGWEANVARVLDYLQRSGIILHWEKGDQGRWKFAFRGERTGRNSCYSPDFYVIWRDRRDRVQYAWLEVKGRLDRGGRLTRPGYAPSRAWPTRLLLTQLDERKDHDSRIKLERWVTQYRAHADQTFVLGLREYRWLERIFSPHVAWEGGRKRVRKAS